MINKSLTYLVNNLKSDGMIKSQEVAHIMLQVDRADFVLDKKQAYQDCALQINYGATISAPHMHAYALECLLDHLQKSNRVLDVGSGSGYLCAAMRLLMKTKDPLVIGVDHVKELIDFSVNNLSKNFYNYLKDGSIQIIQSDGRMGYKQQAPYQVIHVGAAVDKIPDDLIEQLDFGGRMVIPVGKGSQYFQIVDKDHEGNASGIFHQLIQKNNQTHDNELQLMKQLLKIPKGTQDFLPDYTLARRQLLDKFIRIFQLYGAVEIDTPVFELKSVLTNKYGDDEKLIYDLKDQGGEELALRYDLTVPFARFLNSHGIKKIKRYQIGKVYRRDNPSYQSGRFREFLQCDYDICGQYTKNISDAEIISVLSKCMQETNLNYKIRVNHRQIISEILNQIGITKNHNQITSTIDKVDKIGRDQVRQELLNKGLEDSKITLLYQYLFENKQCGSTYEDDLNQIIEYSKIWNAGDIVIDKSLMRGLDYYNGMILECDIGQGVSVAGGGRYDNLINNLNCVGMSIGVDRLMNFIKKQNDVNQDISIITIGNTQEIIKYAIKIHQKLVDQGIKSQICLNMKWNLDKQIQWSLNEQRTRAIIIGENEAQQSSFNFKNLDTREEVKYKFEELKQIK